MQNLPWSSSRNLPDPPTPNSQFPTNPSQSRLTTLLASTLLLPLVLSPTLSPPTAPRPSSTVPSVAPPSTAPLAVTPARPSAPSSPRAASSSTAPSSPLASVVSPGLRPRWTPLRPAAQACSLKSTNNSVKIYEHGRHASRSFGRRLELGFQDCISRLLHRVVAM